jgi:hypothetical protein
MVAAIPYSDGRDKPFLGGDEVMVVFTAERMLRIGFRDNDFLRSR